MTSIGDDWESGLSAAPHPGRRLGRGSEGWGRRDAGESRKGSLALPFPPLELLSKDEFESIHQAALTNCATLDPDSMSPREAHAALYALKGEMTDPQVLAATMLAALLYVVLPGPRSSRCSRSRREGRGGGARFIFGRLAGDVTGGALAREGSSPRRTADGRRQDAVRYGAI